MGLEYQKIAGGIDLSGAKYEFKMAALLLMRGVNHTDGFYLGTNVAGAGAFDDVIFKYKPRGELEFRTCFIQCKHKLDSNKTILLKDIADAKGDFSVYKYYKSSCEVEQNLQDLKYQKSILFDISFEKCDFVIYTNAIVIPADSPATDQSVLERAKMFATGAKQPAILKESTLTELKEKVNTNMKTKKRDRECKELQEFHKALDSGHQFFRNLQWFTQQAKENELDAMIQDEIKTALETNEEDSVKMAQVLIQKMQSWWEEKEGSEVLTETAQLWSDVIVSRLDLMNEAKRKEMEALNISFTDQEIDSFNQSLSSNVINVTSPHGKLSGLKVSQVMEKHHSKRFIYVGEAALLPWKREVLRAWQSVWCDVLVVECSTDATSLAKELSRASPGKKLILLSEFALPGYQQLQDIFTWNQLEVTSQNMLLEKAVDFQGHEVSLGSVVGEHCTHALTGDVVTALTVRGEKLVLGKKIPGKVSNYIPRSLERRDYVKKDMFDENQKEDHFIISNVKEQDVPSLESSYSVRLRKFDENQLLFQFPHHFFWTDGSFTAKTFTKFCQHDPRKNVHWLSVDQNNDVYWKHSFKKTKAIKKSTDKCMKRIIDDQSLRNVNERVFVVAAEPGTGKTTYINNMAQTAKTKDNSRWVITINLIDITKNLDQHIPLYFYDHENVTSFLINMLTNCELDNAILRSRLTRTGNVDVYLDGYDDICPFYNEKATNMINSMKKLKFGQIWLTSRNVMRHHLESKLVSFCFSMMPFTEEDQIRFIVNLWNSKHSIQINDTSREFARYVLQIASESFSDRDREFTGIPLQCMMLGELFAEDAKRGELNFPNRMDLLQLFDKFIMDQILSILNIDKDQMDFSNRKKNAKGKRKLKIMMENHSSAAILMLLSDGEMALLKVNKYNIASTVKERFSVGEQAWTGLVDGMTDGKPSFIHRCFAEYFLAWWLSENISSSIDFIKQNLFEPRFVIVRQFFDRLLARDCPLHNAVLSADRKQVETLLTSGADVNQLDKGGRSALHLAASYPDNDLNSDLGFDLISEASIMQLLLTHGSDLNQTDRILQGTSLRYADKTKLWGKGEHLLKNGTKTVGLVEMREIITSLTAKVTQRKQTSSYIRIAPYTLHSIIKHGLVHILQFAVNECKLDLNTHLKTRDWEGKNRLSTLLHLAAKFGQEDCLKFLLARRNKIRLDEDIRLPIHVAAEAGSHNIIPLLRMFGLNAKDGSYDGLNPLHYAARSGQADTVKWLIDAGADVDALTGIRMTPLHFAAMTSHAEVAKCLVEAGADIHAKTILESTPLHFAARSGGLDTIKCLLEAGAEINAVEGTNGTALLSAMTKNNVDLAKWLFEAGADVNITDSENIAPLHYAAEFGELSTVMWMLEAGADVNAKRYHEKTPLHLALENKHTEVAKYLIRAGADQHCADNEGNTPAMNAKDLGPEFIEWLSFTN